MTLVRSKGERPRYSAIARSDPVRERGVPPPGGEEGEEAEGEEGSSLDLARKIENS